MRGAMREPLIYPASIAPGFDQSHIGARNALISAVALPKVDAMVDLMTGVRGALFSINNTLVMDSHLGPSLQNNASNTGLTFAGKSTANDANVTCAFVARPGGAGTRGVFSTDSLVTNGIFFAMASRLLVQAPNSATFQQSAASHTLTNDIPYFAIISVNGSPARCNFLTVRLDNGQIVTSTVAAGITPSAPNGTYLVGRATLHLSTSKMSAVMFANRSMSIAEMLVWAADPWSFWYPR